MRRPLLRGLLLTGVLTLVALPVLHAPQTASACSNPNCIVTVPTPGQIESYVSPITVTATTATFAERATTAQATSIVIPGTLSFTIMDARGNNQGFVASVGATNFTSRLFPLLPLPATGIQVAGTPSVTLVCYGPGTNTCGAGLGLASSVGANLAATPAVAVECPAASIGEGQYAVSVPLRLSVTGMTAEKLGSYPSSYFGTFTVSITEGQPVAAFTGYGCPAF